jgi:hypothetical protein
MKYRKLRIAWSAGWGVAVVLLVVLWVRSYWRMDVVHLPTQQDVIVNSGYGVIRVNVFPKDIPTGWDSGWGWTSEAPKKSQKRPAWSWSSGNIKAVNFPIWPVALIPLVTATIPWIALKLRFTLRTLLIATTLVAS